MTIQTFESAKRAVKNAYVKAGVAYGTIGAATGGLIYHGNSSDSEFTFVLGMAMGIFTTGIGLTDLLGEDSITADARTKTVLDTERRRITTIRPSYALGRAKENTFDYDGITAVEVDQGRLEKLADTGTVEITAFRVDKKPDILRYGGNSVIEQKTFEIPYQEAPFKVRDGLAGLVTKYEELREKLGPKSP